MSYCKPSIRRVKYGKRTKLAPSPIPKLSWPQALAKFTKQSRQVMLRNLALSGNINLHSLYR